MMTQVLPGCESLAAHEPTPEEVEGQFFPTPDKLAEAGVRLLLAHGDYQSGTCVDLGAGDGALCQALLRAGMPRAGVCAVERRSECAPRLEAVAEVVFIADALSSWDADFDLAILNPPYAQTTAFATAALKLAPRVAMLALFQWAATEGGLAVFAERPARIYPCRPRPDFTGKGNNPREHAWYLWERGLRQTTIEGPLYWQAVQP